MSGVGAASRNRDLIAAIGMVIATPLAIFGLILPFHDYAGVSPELARLVDSDSLLFSTLFTILTAGIAMVPLAVWPRPALRSVAVVVLVVAVWNVVNVLSYHGWRGDLVSCHGGCS